MENQITTKGSDPEGKHLKGGRDSADGSTDTPGNVAQDITLGGGQEEKDSHIVDWDGPDDPQNPRNWSKAFRITHVLLVSAFVLYS